MVWSRSSCASTKVSLTLTFDGRTTRATHVDAVAASAGTRQACGSDCYLYTGGTQTVVVLRWWPEITHTKVLLANIRVHGRPGIPGPRRDRNEAHQNLHDEVVLLRVRALPPTWQHAKASRLRVTVTEPPGFDKVGRARTWIEGLR